MMYADSKCKVREEYSPEHVYIFEGPCIVTGVIQTVRVPADELHAYRQGGLIQDALKSVNGDDREFLMSGYSAEGWEIAFHIED